MDDSSWSPISNKIGVRPVEIFIESRRQLLLSTTVLDRTGSKMKLILLRFDQPVEFNGNPSRISSCQRFCWTSHDLRSLSDFGTRNHTRYYRIVLGCIDRFLKYGGCFFYNRSFDLVQ